MECMYAYLYISYIRIWLLVCNWNSDALLQYGSLSSSRKSPKDNPLNNEKKSSAVFSTKRHVPDGPNVHERLSLGWTEGASRILVHPVAAKDQVLVIIRHMFSCTAYLGTHKERVWKQKNDEKCRSSCKWMSGRQFHLQ